MRTLHSASHRSISHLSLRVRYPPRTVTRAGGPAGPHDAVVVGSGPNGLAAAITLAQAGCSVLVLEGAAAVGGGLRSAALTLPGFTHDVCAAVHPMAVSSPFLRTLPLAEHGLEWVHAPAPLAHPFDDGSAAVLERSVAATGSTLGRDAAAWRTLVAPHAEGWLPLAADILRPLRLPRHPLRMARFGLTGLRSAAGLVRSRFAGERARALFAGNAAHSLVPLHRTPTAAFGLTLVAAGHAVGWPCVRGGSQRLADALASYFRALGGEIVTGTPVTSLAELPRARLVLLDVTPRQLLHMAGGQLPAHYRRALERYRYGPGAFKVDWALSEPIPWTAAACRRAGTVHVGGTLAEILDAERTTYGGAAPERPFALVGQPTLVDPTRAPLGRHVGWAYCHVPNGYDAPDAARVMTERLERQIERFAPGFRDIVLERHVMGPPALERHDPNLVGGEISGGLMDLGQLFFRPTVRLTPYRTPLPGLLLCSASTPPGAAVHGMCGYYAARAALGLSLTPPAAPRPDGAFHSLPGASPSRGQSE